MSLEERVDKLEKLYDKLYYETDLLCYYIPKLMDILIKYWSTSKNYRESVMQDRETLREIMKLYDADLQEHFKNHGERAKVSKGRKDII